MKRCSPATAPRSARGIDRDGQGLLATAVDDGWDEASGAQPAGGTLALLPANLRLEGGGGFGGGHVDCFLLQHGPEKARSFEPPCRAWPFGPPVGLRPGEGVLLAVARGSGQGRFWQKGARRCPCPWRPSGPARSDLCSTSSIASVASSIDCSAVAMSCSAVSTGFSEVYKRCSESFHQSLRASRGCSGVPMEPSRVPRDGSEVSMKLSAVSTRRSGSLHQSFPASRSCWRVSTEPIEPLGGLVRSSEGALEALCGAPRGPSAAARPPRQAPWRPDDLAGTAGLIGTGAPP